MSDVPLLKKGIDKCEFSFVGQVFLDDDVISAIKEFRKELDSRISNEECLCCTGKCSYCQFTEIKKKFLELFGE